MEGQVSPHFTQHEIGCHCGCGGTLELEFLKILETLREEADFPFVITSGYRCPDYNQKVARSGPTGPHTTGRAIDIAISGTKAKRILKLALKHGFIGIGINQKGKKEERFIHLDTVTDDIWSY